MAEIYRPIDADTGIFAPSVAIRQWTVINMTAAPVYINLSSDIPTATNRDYFIPRQQTFTGPPCNTGAISWRTALTPSSQRPVLIVYTEVQGGVVQTLHEPSLGDQCAGYPDVHNPVLGNTSWRDLPAIPPNVHSPVVFYISTPLFKGTVACVLARNSLAFGAQPRRQHLYACGRVGVFTYTFPDAQPILPALLVFTNSGHFEPGDPPNAPITVDAYYSAREQCHQPNNYQFDLNEPPLSLAPSVLTGAQFGVMPGYWRSEILVGSVAASILTVVGTLVYGYADAGPDRSDNHTFYPSTVIATPNTGAIAALTPILDIVVPVSKPAVLAFNLTNTGASTIGAIHVHLHKL